MKKDFYSLLKNNMKAKPLLMGLGIPTRTPSYILGYCPKTTNLDAEPKLRRKKNYSHN